MSKQIELDDQELELLDSIFEFTSSRLKVSLGNSPSPGAVFAINWTQSQIAKLQEKFSDLQEPE